MPKVYIVGWQTGFMKISTTRLLKDRLGMGLKAAKDCVDRVLENEVVILEIDDLDAAEDIPMELSKLGAIVEVRD